MKPKSFRNFFPIVLFSILFFRIGSLTAQDSPWVQVGKGLFIGEFVSQQSIAGDSKITIIKNYNVVIQNLRLIKRPAQNRWSQQNRKWSEAALCEDKAENVLIIFSRSPFSMHDFNNILISLPIDIVCAQHLEGGPEASLYFRHNNTEIELCGSYETSFNENDNNSSYWPIPNVIGIVKKKQ